MLGEKIGVRSLREALSAALLKMMAGVMQELCAKCGDTRRGRRLCAVDEEDMASTNSGSHLCGSRQYG